MDLHCIYLSQKRKKPPDLSGGFFNEILGALEGIRTPNLLIRSQMLYPLSYERRHPQYRERGLPRQSPGLAFERPPTSRT